jgi:hypothetical protein
MEARSVRHGSPATAGALDLSGATEADGDFTGFDDDGNIATAVGKLQHSCKTLLVFQYVDVLDRNFAAGISLPGARGVGSEVFSKDKNFFVHFLLNQQPLTAKISVRQLNCK